MKYFTDYINNSNIKSIGTTATTTKEIFVTFAMRDGVDGATAAVEFDFIEGKNKEEYMRASRIGMASIGGRSARSNLFMTYCNAKNHASI